MKTATKAIALLMSICLGAFASFAGTGWIQTTGGAQQFLDPANWDEGDVNGVFPAGWTSGTASTHSIRITNDWSGTIRFYGNIVKEITFAGYNAANTKAEARTITLTDDLVIQPAVSQYSDSRLTFDANIGFNLGGVTRTFFGNSAIGGKLRFNGPISNGNLVIDGDGAIISLLSTSAVDGNVTVRPNTTFAFDYPGAANTVKRAGNVELRRSTLSVNTHNYDHTSQIDALTVTGEDVPGVSFLQAAHNNKVVVFEVGSLSITNGSVTVQTVVDSSQAWLSFALGANGLVPADLTSDDIKIESFKPAAADGDFAFEVSIADVGVGSGVTITDAHRETVIDNIKKVLTVEGAATLAPNLFSSDNIEVTFDTPAEGRARFTATPATNVGNTFFMRVKVR